MNPTESLDASVEAPTSSPHSFTLDSLREQTISRPQHRRNGSDSSTITVIYSPIPSPCHQQSIATTEALSNSKSPKSTYVPPAFTTAKDTAPSSSGISRDAQELKIPGARSTSIVNHTDFTRNNNNPTQSPTSKAHSSKENPTTTPASFSATEAPLSNIGEAPSSQDLQPFGPFTIPVRRRARANSEQFPDFPTINLLSPPQGSQTSQPDTASIAATTPISQSSASSSLRSPRTHLRSASNGSALSSPGYSSSTPPITKVRTRGRARSTTITSAVNPLEEPITAEEQAVSNLAQAINRQNRREASFSKLYDSPIARAGTWSGGDQFKRSPLQQNPRGAPFRSPFKSRSPEGTTPNSPVPFPVLAELPEQSYTPAGDDHKPVQ
jgi:hypothetical protein